MSPAKKPFRLFDLATELQDLIEEFYFASQVITIGKGDPYLEVLRTRKDKEKHESAKATCYKNATFTVRENNLKAFLKNAQPHTRHIKDIRLVRLVKGIQVKRLVGPPDRFTNIPDTKPSVTLMAEEEAKCKAKIEEMFHVAPLERELGLEPFTLKVAVKVMNRWTLLWCKYTREHDAVIEEAVAFAGYPQQGELDEDYWRGRSRRA